MIRRCFPSWSRAVAVLAIGIVLFGVGQAVLAQPFQPINLSTPTPTQPVLDPDIPIREIPEIATLEPLPPTEEPSATEIPVDEEQVQDQQPAEPPIGTGEVTVALRTCGIYIDPTAIANPDSCVDLYDGVVFDLILANSGDMGQQATTGTAGTGSATFANVAAGNYVLGINSIPDAYQSAFLWNCTDNAAGNLLFNPPAADYPRASLIIAEGQSITCDWYMVEDEPTFDMSVDKFSCPEGTDRTLDFATLKQLCPNPLEGISFQTHDYDLGNQTTDANGHVAWADVTKDSQGKLGLGEEVPAGYGEPVVWCATVQAGFDAPFDSDHIQVDTAGGWFELAPDLHEPYIFTCTYFNMPLPVGDQVLTVYALTCPEDIEADDFPDYAAKCLAPANDVAFTVTSPGGTTTQSTADGETSFQQVAGGEIGITEAFPAGYDEAQVDCQGSGIWSGSVITVHYPTYSHDFEGANFPMVCVFYQVPVEEKHNSITLWTWECPSGTAPGLEYEQYALACTTEMTNVPFTLTDDLGDHDTLSQAGGVTFTDVMTEASGSYQLTESVPDGFRDPVFFCRVAEFLIDPGNVPSASGASVSFNRPPSTDSWEERCDVFNIPEGEAGSNTVLIDTFRCPEGTGTTESFDVYLATCLEVVHDAEFIITTAAGMSTADTSNGQIVMTQVPDGTVEIQEQIPAGFGAPVIFCDVDGAWFAFDSPSGYVARDVANSGVVACIYFNMPADGGSITIEKHLCPVDFDLAGLDLLQALAACPATNDPFTFSASGPNGALPDQQTGDFVPGAVVFANIPAGSYTISEAVPAGFTTPMVLRCDGFISGQLQPYPLATGDSLVIDLADGEHLTCFWLNVPEGNPATGTLTVIKYTCTTEIFISNVDCQIEEDGQAFSLSAWDGDSYEPFASGTTNAVGELTWSNLAPGTYLLEEPGASWCHLVASIPSPPDVIGLMVKPGQENVVQVLNCDGVPGDPGETPTNYPDTGIKPVMIHRDQP